MSSIIASVVFEDARQLDGRRYIRERHIDYLENTHERIYLAEAGQVIDLVTSAALIDSGLTDTELAANEAEVLNADV